LWFFSEPVPSLPIPCPDQGARIDRRIIQCYRCGLHGNSTPLHPPQQVSPLGPAPSLKCHLEIGIETKRTCFELKKPQDSEISPPHSAPCQQKLTPVFLLLASHPAENFVFIYRRMGFREELYFTTPGAVLSHTPHTFNNLEGFHCTNRERLILYPQHSFYLP